MPSVLDRLPKGASVAILRVRSLGDCVLTTPAIRILKEYRSDLRIGVAVERRFAGVFQGNADVAAIVDPAVTKIRRLRPKLCLNLHGGSTSARLTALSGARYRAGFGHYSLPFVYNLRIPRAQEILGEERPVHTAEHLASAMFWLGVPVREIPRAQLFAQPERQESAYAVIHPFASQEEKRWPARFFLQLAQHMKRELDLQPVFISGPGEDLSTFQMWPTVPNPPLQRTKELLAGASLFAGNDSGPAHMAAAFGIPVMVFFGPSDPVTWAPWRTPAEVLVSDGPIYSISPQQAFTALEKLCRGVHA
jgi:ADP-heptose:LPS heptosyltransferase